MRLTGKLKDRYVLGYKVFLSYFKQQGYRDLGWTYAKDGQDEPIAGTGTEPTIIPIAWISDIQVQITLKHEGSNGPEALVGYWVDDTTDPGKQPFYSQYKSDGTWETVQDIPGNPSYTMIEFGTYVISGNQITETNTREEDRLDDSWALADVYQRSDVQTVGWSVNGETLKIGIATYRRMSDPPPRWPSEQ